MGASAITESARGEKCTVRLPGCTYDPDTVVFAHVNSVRVGKGMGFKCPDFAGAYCCNMCHDLVDSR